jgi:hypothetical protein
MIFPQSVREDAGDQMKATRDLLYVIGALFTARLVLLGCAPVIGVPSSRPIEAGGSEVGLGGGATSDSRWGSHPSGHLYFRKASEARPIEFGGSVNFYGESLGAGFFTRFNVVNPDSVISWGVQLDLGFIYAGLSVPFAFQLSDSAWLTVQPKVAAFNDGMQDFIGPGPDPGLELPIGVSFSNDSLAADITCGVRIGWELRQFCGITLAAGRGLR